MSAPLTTRDALAEAIHEAIRTTGPGIDCGRIADALLARGALVDATKLIPRTMPATPDAVMRQARTLRYGHYDAAADILTALAAALSAQSERAEVER